MIVVRSIQVGAQAVKRPLLVQARIERLLILGQNAADESEELRQAGCVGLANERLRLSEMYWSELKELQRGWVR